MRAFHDGSILAGYRLERPLGRGGMGEVWLARDARLDRPVALKVLVAALSYDPEFRLRFLEETRLAAALDHPHIVPVYEAGEADGELFLAMRYVEGADLDAIIGTDGPLDPGRVVGLLRGIADALDAAHARGLIHRDVKPGNILVTRTPSGEHAYLTDFGLTKRLDAGTTLGDKIVGSVGYIAPEQIEGGPIDRRSDVYSLGCVVYAALTGESPFVRETDAATLYAHLQAEPAPIDAGRPELTPLEAIVRRALAKSPEDRQDSAGALMREVATALGVGAAAWTTTAGKADIELPYVGLRAFDEADARFYFGREDDVAALVDHLGHDRFLAVFGPSGSGKSSLVRAGLLPALRAGAIPGSAEWPVCVIRPGARPLEALAAQLVRLGPDAAMGRTVDDLATDSRTLHLASTLALSDAPPDRRVVWVVDQAEELFTLCQDDEMRAAAIAALVHAATVPDGRTIVIMAMRADFYHRCAAYPALAAAVARSQFLVTPMDLDGLRRAIIEPARLVGLEFEPGLVDTILDDVAARPGSLPLLEHALFELWDRRRGATMTLAGYRESGGVDGAIAVRAESIYNGLAEADQAIARRVLLRLTQLGEGTEDTRRRATYRELGARTTDDDPVDRVVEELVGARLLTLDSGEGDREPVVDIAHEALLRAWPRIRTWVDEDRSDLTIQRWIADAAAQWERLDRDDDGLFRGARLAQAEEFRTRRPDLLNAAEIGFIEASTARARTEVAATDRRRRLTVAGALVVAAFFVGLSLVAGVLWFQSEGARREAVAARDDAVRANDATTTALAEAERQGRVALSRQLVAQSLVARNDTDLSMLLALESIDHGATNEGTTSLLGGFQARPNLVQTSQAHQTDATRVTVSPNGRLVVSIDSDGHTSIWDVSAGRPTANPLAGLILEELGSARFSPDGTGLAVIEKTSVVAVDLDSGTIRASRTVRNAGHIMAIAWTPDGRSIRWVANAEELNSRTGDVVVSTWDPTTDVLSEQRFDWLNLRPVEYDPGSLTTNLLPEDALSPDGTTVVTIDGDARKLLLFDATTGQPVGQPLDGVFFGFSPDGAHLAAATEQGSIRIVTLPDLAIVGSELLIGDRPDRVFISNDAAWAGVASVDSTFGIWDVASGERRGEPLSMPADPVHGISIASTAPVVSASYWDGRVEVFDLATRATLVDAELGVIPPTADGEPQAFGVAISATGDRVLMRLPSADPFSPTAATGVEGRIWDVAKAAFDPPVRLSPSAVAWTFGADGRYVVLTGKPLDATPGVDAIVASLPAEFEANTFVTSADASIVVASNDTRSIRIDVPTGDQLVLPGALAVDLSPDGRTIVMAHLAPEARSPGLKGRTGLSGGGPAILEISDAATGTPNGQASLSILPSGLAMDPTSTVVAVVGESGTGKGAMGALEIVDLTTGESQVVALIPNRFTAVNLGETGPGRMVVTVDEFGRIQRWDIDPASWRQKACAIAGRNLSAEEWARFVGAEPYRETCPGLPVPTEP